MSGPLVHAKVDAFTPQAPSRVETALSKRRSPARGIMIGLGISAVMWLGIAYIVFSIVRP
ncbi:MAG: hypothetical protein V4653_12545 [Pseudomonadota bacterium]